MPSLVEMYSDPEDIDAFLKQAAFYEHVALGNVEFVPPLMEHGPELDDRFCLKHYQPDVRYGFLNFFRDLRFGPCRDCVEENRQVWLEEVQRKLQRGLEAAQNGEKVMW